jgi:hypothetical protein
MYAKLETMLDVEVELLAESNEKHRFLSRIDELI